MNSLSRWLQFKILSYLNIPDLGSIRKISKYWHQVIGNPDFWTFKMREETQTQYHIDITMAGKVWYERKSRSGQLYFIKNNVFEVDPCGLKDVYLYRYLKGCHYYVDIAGNLYCRMDENSNRYITDYGYYVSYYEYVGIDECVGIGIFRDQFDSNLFKVKQISNVKDVVPTNIGDLILTLDYNLYTIGRFSGQLQYELVFTKSNVKSIGGCDMLCFYLTFDGELWIYRPKAGEIIPELLAFNVKAACTLWESEFNAGEAWLSAEICYLSFDNEVYINYYDQIDRIGVRLDEYQPKTVFSIENMLWIATRDQHSFEITYFRQINYRFQQPNTLHGWNHLPPSAYGKFTKSAFAYPVDDKREYRQNSADLVLSICLQNNHLQTVRPTVGRITNVFETDKIYVTLA